MNIASFQVDRDNLLTIRVGGMPQGATPANTFVLIGDSPTKYNTTVVTWGGLADSTVRLDPPPSGGRITVRISLVPPVQSDQHHHLADYVPPAAALKAPTDILPPPSARAGTKIEVAGKNMNSIDKWFVGDGPGIDPGDASTTKSHFTVPVLNPGRYAVYYSATSVGVQKTNTKKLLQVT
jgi:hypothetical protein